MLHLWSLRYGNGRQEEQNQGWLVPANPAYPRIKITPDDDFSVWGAVTYIIYKARD